MYEKGVASAAPFFLFVHTNYAKICYNIRELIAQNNPGDEMAGEVNE